MGKEKAEGKNTPIPAMESGERRYSEVEVAEKLVDVVFTAFVQTAIHDTAVKSDA